MSGGAGSRGSGTRRRVMNSERFFRRSTHGGLRELGGERLELGVRVGAAQRRFDRIHLVLWAADGQLGAESAVRARAADGLRAPPRVGRPGADATSAAADACAVRRRARRPPQRKRGRCGTGRYEGARSDGALAHEAGALPARRAELAATGRASRSVDAPMDHDSDGRSPAGRASGWMSPSRGSNGGMTLPRRACLSSEPGMSGSAMETLATRPRAGSCQAAQQTLAARPKRSSETTVRRRTQIAQSDSAPSPSAIALARRPLDQRRSLGVKPGG